MAQLGVPLRMSCFIDGLSRVTISSRGLAWFFFPTLKDLDFETFNLMTSLTIVVNSVISFEDLSARVSPSSETVHHNVSLPFFLVKVIIKNLGQVTSIFSAVSCIWFWNGSQVGLESPNWLRPVPTHKSIGRTKLHLIRSRTEQCESGCLRRGSCWPGGGGE